MSMPKVSVIVGVYNTPCKEEVDIALNSVINQTFTEWECVVCDDGSSDDTWDYLIKHYSYDERFIFIRNSCNSGLGAALNNCIMKARTPFLIRQDADDISRSDRFEILYKEMMDTPEAAVIGTSMISFDEHGEHRLRRPRSLYPRKHDFLYGTVVAHASCIIRRDCIICTGLYRVSWETKRCEDYDLFMRMYAAGFAIINIEQPLYYVREDNNTYARKKYGNRIKEAVVRFKGYRLLKMPIWGYIFVFKPLLVGLIPSKVMKIMKDRFHRNG